MTGMFAISRAGHDKGQMYVIIKEDAEFVYLADGKNRKSDNPKKKKRKHIQLVKTDVNKPLMMKLKAQETVYDEEIKRAIKIRSNHNRHQNAFIQKEVTNVKS